MPRKKEPKKTRRARGTGSIHPDKRRGGWRAKKKGVGEKWSRSHAEVVEWLNNALPPAPAATLTEWAKRWLASLDVREQSRETYDVNLRKRILPSLGALPVAKITAFHVEEASKRWASEVGVTTVIQTIGTLSACLQAAVRAELIDRNPARVAKKPRGKKKEHDLFTQDELRSILGAACRDRRLYPFALCAAIGCRIGEAVAVRPAEDYDAATGELTISRTVVRHRKGQPRRFGPPKSPNSLRTVTVPRAARVALSQPPDPASYSAYHKRWRKMLRQLGIRIREVHQLRHSVISHAIAAGVPVANVARDAGDSVGTIVSTYLHPVPGKGISDAMEVLYGGAEVARESENERKPSRKRRK